MKITNRRNFRKSAAIAASGIIAVPVIIPSCTRGGNGRTAPSDKVRIALIGCGNQGGSDILRFANDDRVEGVAIGDVSIRRFGRAC